MDSPRRFRFGDFDLDEERMELRRSGEAVALAPRAYRLLLYLLEHRDRVLSREELLERVWPGVAVSDATIFSALRDVRVALSQGRPGQRWIETRRNVGYRFMGSVEVILRDAQDRSPPAGGLYALPRGPSQCFVGRNKELDQLEELLTRPSFVSVRAAVEGPAGIGKTELALQFAHRAAHEQLFSGGVFWLDAESPDLRPIWGTSIAERYGLAQPTLDERCQVLLRRLSERRDPVLVVLDNVTAWSATSHPTPLPEGPHVRVLVTTRTRNLAGAQFMHLALGVLPQPYDRELVERLAGRDPGPALDDLLAHLGGHTLALELAAAFLATYSTETAQSYLEALRQNADAVEIPVADRVGYEASVAQAFLTVWERLSSPVRAAWQLAACFEPEWASQALAQAVRLDSAALRALEALHLIQISHQGRWRMHRLTRDFGQRAGRGKEVPAARTDFVEGCLRYAEALEGAQGGTVYARDRAQFDAALGMAQELWEEASPKVRMLRRRIGIGRDSLGDVSGARELLEPLVHAYRSTLTGLSHAQTPLEWASNQLELGQVLLKLGSREPGPDLLEEAVKTYRAWLAADARELDPHRWGMVQRELGQALYALGDRQSNPVLLEEAVSAFRAALGELSRERAPLEWAGAQHDLASALSRLGWRESGSQRLQEAMGAYRSAQLERTRERLPVEWGRTQVGLAAMLWGIGMRESGTERLQESIAAFRLALLEITRERTPLDWASAQSGLANALLTLGQRESGTRRLHDAIAAFQQALLEHTRERVPLDWAQTQNNLANALWTLGLREPGTQRLREAVQAYREALLVRTREQAPLAWANTLNNLANALFSLGERESGTESLREAVRAYQDSLLECTRERVPRAWAQTQNNLGGVLRVLGERESGTERLEEAVEACRQALLEHTREHLPLPWSVTQHVLGRALRVLGQRESGTERLEAAVDAFRRALLLRTRESAPPSWAQTNVHLSKALRALGERESGSQRLEEAAETCRQALLEIKREAAPLDWGTALSTLGAALTSLGKRENGTARVEEAIQAFRDALLELTRDRVPLGWAETQSELGDAWMQLGVRTSQQQPLESAVQAYLLALEVQTPDTAPLECASTQKKLADARACLAKMSGT